MKSSPEPNRGDMRSRIENASRSTIIDRLENNPGSSIDLRSVMSNRRPRPHVEGLRGSLLEPIPLEIDNDLQFSDDNGYRVSRYDAQRSPSNRYEQPDLRLELGFSHLRTQGNTYEVEERYTGARDDETSRSLLQFLEASQDPDYGRYDNSGQLSPYTQRRDYESPIRPTRSPISRRSPSTRYSPVRQLSPLRRPSRRSPSLGARRQSPHRGRSPSPLTRPSRDRSTYRRRSPSPYRRRSPSPLKRPSRSSRRSRSPRRSRQSPPPLRRSPPPLRRSPSPLTRPPRSHSPTRSYPDQFCFKCEKYGHLSLECPRYPRVICLDCNGPHPTRTCPDQGASRRRPPRLSPSPRGKKSRLGPPPPRKLGRIQQKLNARGKQAPKQGYRPFVQQSSLAKLSPSERKKLKGKPNHLIADSQRREIERLMRQQMASQTATPTAAPKPAPAEKDNILIEGISSEENFDRCSLSPVSQGSSISLSDEEEEHFEKPKVAEYRSADKVKFATNEFEEILDYEHGSASEEEEEERNNCQSKLMIEPVATAENYGENESATFESKQNLSEAAADKSFEQEKSD